MAGWRDPRGHVPPEDATPVVWLGTSSQSGGQPSCKVAAWSPETRCTGRQDPSTSLETSSQSGGQHVIVSTSFRWQLNRNQRFMSSSALGLLREGRFACGARMFTRAALALGGTRWLARSAGRGKSAQSWRTRPRQSLCPRRECKSGGGAVWTRLAAREGGGSQTLHQWAA